MTHSTRDALIHTADHGLCMRNDPRVREDSEYSRLVDSEAVQLSIYESLVAGVPPTYSLLSLITLSICLALALILPLPFREILWPLGPSNPTQPHVLRMQSKTCPPKHTTRLPYNWCIKNQQKRWEHLLCRPPFNPQYPRCLLMQQSNRIFGSRRSLLSSIHRHHHHY